MFCLGMLHCYSKHMVVGLGGEGKSEQQYCDYWKGFPIAGRFA